jgi:peptidyl-prolyl cis-trans isomerase SurA
MLFGRRSLKCFNSHARRLAAVLAFLFIGLASVAQEEGSTGFVVDKIIAKVDNYIVLKSELDRAYLDYVANGGQAGDQARCQFLALLIRNKLMMAKAEIDSVVVSDDEVDANTNRRMQMILSQYGGSAEELETKFGKSFEQIRLELRDQIREQMVVSEMERTIAKDITVTPAEVRRFFNRIPKDSLPFFSAEVEVAQIVKVAEVSAKQKEETKRQLIDLRNRLLAGEDFGTLAKKYSSDPSVTSNNGDMGWLLPRLQLYEAYW